MRTITRAAMVLAVAATLAGCLSAGRGRGPIDSFAFLTSANKSLSHDVTAVINERAEPKEVSLVVPPGTDLHNLVATISLNKEAVVAVVSSGSRVVQQNGVTPNDFSVTLTYSVEVSGDKKPWSYKVFVREAETNARLSTLVVPAGTTLQPQFNPAVHSYTLTVPFASTSVRIEARGQSRLVKSVSVNGAETPGPVGAAHIDFAGVAERPVPIEALAEDGVTREQYTVDIMRAPPDNNALLSTLELQDVALSPSFSPFQLTYQAQVPFQSRQLVVRARAQSPVASISLGLAATSGGGAAALAYNGSPSDSAGALVDFSRGDTLSLSVIVTAEDGSTQSYLLDVQRAPPDHNSSLAALSFVSSSGAVIATNPAFAPGRLAYAAEVPYATQKITVIAAPQSTVASAALEIGPAFGARGALNLVGDLRTGAQLDLPPQARVVLGVAVTAQDGSMQRYVVEVRRAPPDRNSDLGALSATAGTLSPAFSPRSLAYSLVLPADAESVRISAAAASPLSLLAVTEQPGLKPAQGQVVTINVAPGYSVITTFVVSAEDGSQRTYRVQVTRMAPPVQQPTQPPAGQAGAGSTAPVLAPIPLPGDNGTDRVIVSAKNLRLRPAEAQALQAAHDSVGALARITVRSYRSSNEITKYTVPMEARQEGQNLAISLSSRSNGLTLARDGLVEVELAIPTTAGRFLYYTEAQPAGSEVAIDVPFLLYGDNPRVSWPPLGSAVQVAGYLLRLPPGSARAADKEDFDRNGKGEYAVSVEMADAHSGVSYGKGTASVPPGVGRDRVIAFGAPLSAPEGATVRYSLTAAAKNGRLWAASGTSEIWTTKLAYPSGFQPAAFSVYEELAAQDKGNDNKGKN